MSTLVLGEGAGATPLDFLDPALDSAAVAGLLRETEATKVVWLPPANVLAAGRGTYALACAAAEVGIERLVVVSTLAVFARHPRNWRLRTNWRPMPSTEPHVLAPYLAELSAREVARATGLRVTVLRRGESLSDEALTAALADTEPWKVRHDGDGMGRPETDGGRSWHEVLAAPEPIASRPIRKIAVLGAGGPIGRVVVDALKDRYTLRVADIAPLAEAKAQSHDAPVARPVAAPHEEVRLDVRDYGSVLDACSGCDAIINLTVVRHQFADAFAVNALGAWNVGRAAAALGIRRVVHTGPQLITLHNENDFSWDFQIACDAPTRPGKYLYGHSKFLGNEAMRVLAEWHDLEVPNLMFNGFAQPGITQAPHGPSAMMTSWDDAARAIVCALEVASLPSPYEEFHCVADFPHQQCRTDKARLLLGWQPQDPLDDLWRDLA